jgi:hypothetical protein
VSFCNIIPGIKAANRELAKFIQESEGGLDLTAEEREARRKRCEKRWSGFFVGDTINENDEDQVLLKVFVFYLLIYVLVITVSQKRRRLRRLKLLLGKKQ